MKHYIITYDISDDKRRNKIYKLLRDYAVPVQYSVFEARLKDEDYLLLRYKLERLMKRDTDSIIFYRQCIRCQKDILRLGRSGEPFGDGIFIL
ncbi:CRISPR-associated endonuclease Cas2 [Desulfolucanica intricata]|uniref:CRISPR-associated endonuclease Cas2 n=1 Tax=Desulfolucanica intricata TaxID=1285191 RepID=UPI000831924D|nr:CRISPR-associated endonuclease Cas2 [Desulfolucanica intricata]